MASPRSFGTHLAAALSCTSFVLLAACTSQSPSTVAGPSVASSTPSRSAKHQALAGAAPLVVIFMENHEQDAVVGSSSAPYENSLIHRGRSYTNYFAISHPSLPNYLAFASGSTYGKTD